MCIEDTRRHRRYPEQVCCSCPSNNEIYNISRSTHRIDQPIDQLEEKKTKKSFMDIVGCGGDRPLEYAGTWLAHRTCWYYMVSNLQK